MTEEIINKPKKYLIPVKIILLINFMMAIFSYSNGVSIYIITKYLFGILLGYILLGYILNKKKKHSTTIFDIINSVIGEKRNGKNPNELCTSLTILICNIFFIAGFLVFPIMQINIVIFYILILISILFYIAAIECFEFQNFENNYDNRR
jgi:hypothetical protein